MTRRIRASPRARAVAVVVHGERSWSVELELDEQGAGGVSEPAAPPRVARAERDHVRLRALRIARARRLAIAVAGGDAPRAG